ncbi:hypothetical protein [Pontibacter sp. G13]|uniref:hypothetical protein n=1 Tax=Pontibacter sp. G13 TaxID=3074898 RepID=UPI00288968CF|nr:hypothetical protein [Pontibacter sp. G13]WNJ19619.1 hypothetical protein RJD25_03960 [Pontibacter sp. G13]
MNLRQKRNLRDLILLMTFFITLMVAISYRYDIVYSKFPSKYTVAYDFKYIPSSKGSFFKYKYMISGEEYSSTFSCGYLLSDGINIDSRYFSYSDKYMLEYPVIAKRDPMLHYKIRLPDSTSIPFEPWDEIPKWVENSASSVREE